MYDQFVPARTISEVSSPRYSCTHPFMVVTVFDSVVASLSLYFRWIYETVSSTRSSGAVKTRYLICKPTCCFHEHAELSESVVDVIFNQSFPISWNSMSALLSTIHLWNDGNPPLPYIGMPHRCRVRTKKGRRVLWIIRMWLTAWTGVSKQKLCDSIVILLKEPSLKAISAIRSVRWSCGRYYVGRFNFSRYMIGGVRW